MPLKVDVTPRLYLFNVVSALFSRAVTPMTHIKRNKSARPEETAYLFLHNVWKKSIDKLTRNSWRGFGMCSGDSTSSSHVACFEKTRWQRHILWQYNTAQVYLSKTL